MRELTIAQADRIKEKILAPSRSDAIRRAIEIADALIGAIEQGDRVLIKGRRRTREVLIPGLLGQE